MKSLYRIIATDDGKHFRPQAIDVYRDKTELEITYRDGVAVDSVVVYKIK